ncbi:hypothetical protein B0H14DRAFT_2591680 [Mycena olivaceomarginata]|nr:hypothetical protein B0H14DRAFT_2591680 [Mycena olivaceomarginata]
MAQTTGQPVKQCCGRPHKNPNKPKDTVPKLTLKIPSHPDKSASPMSNSDSEVIETTNNQSSISIDNTMTIWIWPRQQQKAYWKEQDKEDKDEADTVDKEDKDKDKDKDNNFDFHLEFVVPVGGATDTVTVSSAITHTQLFDQITEEMGVCKRELNIAYKFSWLKDKDKPKLLSTPNHIVKLFKDACEELVDRKKPDAKVLKKKFEVMITDLSTKNGKEKTDKAAKKPQSKGKRCTDDSDSETDTQVDKGKKTPAQALHDLEQDQCCEKHNCFCAVVENGEHITLTNNNMSLWSLMLIWLHTSTTLPPATLGLSMTTGTKAAAPSHRAPQNAPLPPPPPYPYYYPPGPYPHVYYPPPPAPPMHLPDPVPAPPATNLKKTISIDSNDNNNLTLFPTIKD